MGSHSEPAGPIATHDGGTVKGGRLLEGGTRDEMPRGLDAQSREVEHGRLVLDSSAGDF